MPGSGLDTHQLDLTYSSPQFSETSTLIFQFTDEELDVQRGKIMLQIPQWINSQVQTWIIHSLIQIPKAPPCVWENRFTSVPGWEYQVERGTSPHPGRMATLLLGVHWFFPRCFHAAQLAPLSSHDCSSLFRDSLYQKMATTSGISCSSSSQSTRIQETKLGRLWKQRKGKM